jgi:hypothetical protein
MSKTKKVARLQRKVDYLEKQLAFANSEFCQRINRPVKFQTTERPVFRSSDSFEEQHLNTLIHYIYSEMDKAYNMACQMGETDPSEVEFILYMDHDTYYDLHNINNYHDFKCDVESGKIKFRGHEVVLTTMSKRYVHFARIK